MLEIEQKTGRNQAIDCLRLLCAVLVVFLHVPFPGKVGEVVSCLARLAVPFFFLVSGFYSDHSRPGKRLRRLLRLNVGATALYFLWGAGKAAYWEEPFLDYIRRMFPDFGVLRDFLLFQVNPFGGHLWYLPALMVCYLVLAAYQRITRKGDGPLYVLGAVLMAAFFLLSTVFPGKVHYYVYRNGFLMGLPVFLLGRFLGSRRWRLGDGALGAMVLGGLILGFGQWFLLGPTEIPVGILLAAAAGLLLLDRHDRVSVRWMRRAARHLGQVSTGIYVGHLLWRDVYEMFGQARFADRFGGLEPWVQPFAVLGMALVTAVAWEFLRGLVQKRS